MSRIKILGAYLISLLLVLLVLIGTVTGSSIRPRDTERRIDSLLSIMTLEEKAGQMLILGLPTILTGGYWDARDTAVIDTARLIHFIGSYGVGSIHNTPGYPPKKDEWHRLVSTIQDYAINNTRLGIPVIYGIDNIHGANYVLGSTMTPHQIALAATWNTALVEELARITSYESRAASLPWNYNPNADVAPNPLWGRMAESFGEDQHLVSQMTVAYTRGAQGEALSGSTSNAVCVKHYLGYGAGANGKDRANAIIPENYLRQYYIPPFKAAIDAGAMSTMISSNAVNGVPNHVNQYYIEDILKGELGFKGAVVSDFSDIDFLVDAHQVAHSKREATKMAVNAGLDMIMNPFGTDVVDMIVDLVRSNQIPMERIDDAARRVLRLKFALNLFESPYNHPSEYPLFGSDKHAKANYNAASEAITLLKNNETLPLPRNSRVLVTGYAANSMNVLNGAWSRTFLGQDTRFNDPSKLTILDAIKASVGEKNVTYVQGTDYLTDVNIKEAVRRARSVDYIVICVGELPATEKPSDINELELPPAQQELVRRLAATGKPIVLVMVQGRPRIIRSIEPLAQAIIMAYLPGDEGGRAIADVIFGDINPSGRLPYTYPKYSGNMLPYWHKKADIRDINWGYHGFYPQYEFGFGLSYTSYMYSNLKLSTDTVVGCDPITISVDVTNTGHREGKEVVQLYLSDLVALLAPDVKRLVGFQKVTLAPNQKKTVSFTLSKEQWTYVGMDGKWTTEGGRFMVQIGGNPSQMQMGLFYHLLE